MKRKTKSIFKKISLVIAGAGTFGLIAVGETNILEYVRDDSKSLSLSYEVGGLDANGKYEENESSLYTKEQFACECLKAVLQFDAQIN